MKRFSALASIVGAFLAAVLSVVIVGCGGGGSSNQTAQSQSSTSSTSQATSSTSSSTSSSTTSSTSYVLTGSVVGMTSGTTYTAAYLGNSTDTAPVSASTGIYSITVPSNDVETTAWLYILDSSGNVYGSESISGSSLTVSGTYTAPAITLGAGGPPPVPLAKTLKPAAR